MRFIFTIKYLHISQTEVHSKLKEALRVGEWGGAIQVATETVLNCSRAPP